MATADRQRVSRATRPPLPEGPFLVVGLAKSGQAAARLLSSRGQTVTGVDAGRPQGVDTLGDFGVGAHLESDGLELLDQAETLIKSPGVPSDAPVIAHAQAAGKTVIGELELGWRLLPNYFIAVTGTNGKTTTTELLGAIFRAAGLPVAVAGNVGTPVTELVGAIDPDATVICEASSFQLEDAPCFAPDVGVLLNLAPDHLDRHGSFENYRDAKLSMFARQNAEQFAIAGASVGEELPGGGTRVAVGQDAWPGRPAAGIAMKGRHNLENAQLAALAAASAGVDEAAIEQALTTFTGVEHRMEIVDEIDGVEFINDSKATNVAAALAALESFDGNVHAILGGSLKGERFAALGDAVKRSCLSVHLNGQSAPQLEEDLAQAGVPLTRHETQAQAFAAAAATAREGEVVLLSPACASFDQFQNYEQRGSEFKRLVAALARG